MPAKKGDVFVNDLDDGYYTVAIVLEEETSRRLPRAIQVMVGPEAMIDGPLRPTSISLCCSIVKAAKLLGNIYPKEPSANVPTPESCVAQEVPGRDRPSDV